MSKPEFCVGIDVGKDELHVSMAKSKLHCVKNNRSGIRKLVRSARQVAGDLPLRYCLEATGVYSLSCISDLHGCDESGLISVVNPAQISAYSRAQLRRVKTDRVDARVIRSFAETQELHDWHAESPITVRLCQQITQADALRADIRQWKNRGHAQSFQPELDNTVRQTQRAIVRSLENQLAKLGTAIHDLCKQDESLNAQVELLCGIPGIAELSAVRLLAYGKSTLTEYSRKELTAHAGLAPRHHRSGSSVRGKSRIAKQGDRRLRSALYMPVLVGIVHNPVLKRMYQRLLNNGKPKMVAIVACMRKLLLIIQAMIKKQQQFDPKMA